MRPEQDKLQSQSPVRGQRTGTGCRAPEIAVFLLKLFMWDHLWVECLTSRGIRCLTDAACSRDDKGGSEFEEQPFQSRAEWSGKYT